MNRIKAVVAAVTVMMYAAAVQTAQAKNVRYTEHMSCGAPFEWTPSLAQGPAQHEQIAQTPNGPIAYYRFGKGTPIVLVTGYRSTLAEWNSAFLVELAKHHEVIVFDNRGIGHSDPTATSFTVKEMASDTENLIDALHLSSVTVLGWSMGGAVVQQLAIDAPASVSKIVLMNTFAPGPTGASVPPSTLSTLSGKSGADLRDIMGVLFPAKSVDAAVDCFEKDMFRPADYHEAKLSEAVDAGQTALLNDWSHDQQAADALRDVKIPALILTGASDDVLSPTNGRALASLLPGSRSITVDQGGHAMMYQYPRELADAIGAFAMR